MRPRTYRQVTLRIEEIPFESTFLTQSRKHTKTLSRYLQSWIVLRAQGCSFVMSWGTLRDEFIPDDLLSGQSQSWWDTSFVYNHQVFHEIESAKAANRQYYLTQTQSNETDPTPGFPTENL